MDVVEMHTFQWKKHHQSGARAANRQTATNTTWNCTNSRWDMLFPERSRHDNSRHIQSSNFLRSIFYRNISPTNPTRLDIWRHSLNWLMKKAGNPSKRAQRQRGESVGDQNDEEFPGFSLRDMIWGFPKRMVFLVENPIQIDDLGVAPCMEPPISTFMVGCWTSMQIFRGG